MNARPSFRAGRKLMKQQLHANSLRLSRFEGANAVENCARPRIRQRKSNPPVGYWAFRAIGGVSHQLTRPVLEEPFLLLQRETCPEYLLYLARW